MSINFATLRSLSIPEGVVTRIEKDGLILWHLREIVQNRLMDRNGIYLMTSNGEYITVLGEGNLESTDSAYDVDFENGVLYIKSAPATLDDTTLEVR